MVKNINILFIGGAKRISLLERFISAAKIININLNFYSYELNEIVPIAKIAKIIKGLKWNDSEIEDHLYDSIINNSINIVIPNVDPAIAILAKIKKKCPKVFFSVSEYNICKIFYDKIKADKWLEDNGFPIPSKKKQFPMIAKPRFGSASKGIKILEYEEDFKKFSNNFNIKDYLIQQFINAEEYTVDGYINPRNQIIGTVPRKRLSIVGGESVLSSIDLDKNIISISHKIINSAKFTGPITLQFLKEKETGQLFMMEINPRFGGGVILSIEAGLNIPYYILCDFLNIEYDINKKIKDNLIMSRFFKEVFFETNN